MAKRVLVADDSPLIRKMLCQLFEREDDYDICAEAENGEQAIELALKHRPDLIILDWATKKETKKVVNKSAEKTDEGLRR
jgi:chemotaxis response regulator CheB